MSDFELEDCFRDFHPFLVRFSYIFSDIQIFFYKFNSQSATEITMSFYLLTILEITEKEEEMVTSGYTTQSWTDPRLAWDPENYLGLNKTRVKAGEVWKPNIILYNSDDGEFKSYIQETNVVITYTGVVEWLPPALFRSG